MSYLKQYFKALFMFMSLMGSLFLVLSALLGSPNAIYFLYLSSIGALAAPIGLWIDRRTKFNAK